MFINIKSLHLLNNSKRQDWKDKYVIAFGDSIIAGQELKKEETPYRDIVYPKLASYFLNARKFDNFAETGTGQFKGQHYLDKLTGWTHNFSGTIYHYKEDIRRADVALISYGNNDWKQLNSDGNVHTLSDVEETLKNNIKLIRRLNPKIELIGILETLAFRKHKSAWYLKGPNEFDYSQMVQAYISIFKEMDVKIFDLRDYHVGNSIEDYVDDRDHFTKIKHQEIALHLEDFVRNGGKSFYSDFKTTIKILDINNELNSPVKIDELNKSFKFATKDDLTEIIKFNELSNKIKSTSNNIRYIYVYEEAEIERRKELIFEYKQNLKRTNKVVKKDGKDVLLQKLDCSWEKLSEPFFFDYWLRHYLSTKDVVYILYENKLSKINIVNFMFHKLFID